MIDYIKDMLVPGKITIFPYKMTGPIAIASRNGHYLRCPAWGTDKTIIKYDENFVYVKSDIAGKIDLFDKEGIKVTTKQFIDIKFTLTALLFLALNRFNQHLHNKSLYFIRIFMKKIFPIQPVEFKRKSCKIMDLYAFFIKKSA